MTVADSRLGLLENADWVNEERRHLTHRLVEHKEIYFRPLCPHKRSRDCDSLPLHVQDNAASEHPPRCFNIRGITHLTAR